MKTNDQLPIPDDPTKWCREDGFCAEPHVIELLQQDGWEVSALPTRHWYTTDCPLWWNKEHRLDAGQVLRSFGTHVKLIS
jgi:hypothetical protein